MFWHYLVEFLKFLAVFLFGVLAGAGLMLIYAIRIKEEYHAVVRQAHDMTLRALDELRFEYHYAARNLLDEASNYLSEIKRRF